MPLYEYQCDACGARFERIQKFSDPPIEQCPKCNGHVHKLLSSPAIQFKGSGFYINDYQRKGSSTSLPDHGESEKKSKDEKPPAPAAEKPGKKSSKKD